MKKYAAAILAGVMILGVTSCGQAPASSASSTPAESSTTASEPFYKSTSDVTMESICERTYYENILPECTAVQSDLKTDGSSDANVDSAVYTAVIRQDGDRISCHQNSDYADGGYTHIYFSNDPDDSTLYVKSDLGFDSAPLGDSSDMAGLLGHSFLGYDSYDSELTSVTEENGQYIANVENTYGGSLFSRDTLKIDPATGYVTECTTTYITDGVESGSATQVYTYSADLTVDDSPKTENPDVSTSDADTSSEPAASSGSETVTFNTTDIDGNAVTEEMVKNAKLVMYNYWEPWCKPCVGEMPDLQKLYENYKDKGLLILGVYSTTEMDDDARDILEAKGITYPILRCDDNLAKYAADYVPSTFFTDSEGNILNTEKVIGAHEYDEWAEMVESYLN